jgi:hypothetical protein
MINVSNPFPDNEIISFMTVLGCQFFTFTVMVKIFIIMTVPH